MPTTTTTTNQGFGAGDGTTPPLPERTPQARSASMLRRDKIKKAESKAFHDAEAVRGGELRQHRRIAARSAVQADLQEYRYRERSVRQRTEQCCHLAPPPLTMSEMIIF